MFTLGVTGGIGSGKSVVTQLFESKGIYVVDADVVAREVVAPGHPGLSAISSHFGKRVINSEGELNRKALREIIFLEPKQKNWLESLLHPMIRTRVSMLLSAGKSAPYQIYSAPLLLENNQQNIVDRVLVVDCEEQTQITRATERDSTSVESIQKIIQQQIGRKKRLQLADYVIDNNGSLESTALQVDKIHQEILQLA